MSDIASPPAEPPPPFSTAPAVQNAEGDRAVDFSTFGQKSEPEPAPEPTPEPTPEPAPEPKPPEVKPPEHKLEPEAKKPEPAPEPEKKVEAKTEVKKDPKLLTEEEIESLTTKKGVPETVIKSFNEMKGLLGFATKTAKQKSTELEQVRAQLEEAVKQTLPPETAKELEDLRTFKQIWDTENDPAFQERVQGTFDKADKALFDILKSPTLGVDESGEKDIRAHLDDKYDPTWINKNIIEPLNGDPLLQERVRRALLNRAEAYENRDAEIANLSKTRETERAKMQENQKKSEQEWVDKAKAKTNELATKYGDSWAAFKAVPENATPEQKASIDKFNAEVKGRAEQFQQTIAKVWGRDPELTTEVIFKSMHADHVDAQLAAKAEELAAAQARITELENLISAAKGAGRQSSVRTVASDNDEKSHEKKVMRSGDARAAFQNFFGDE